MIYSEGESVEKNDAEAFKWYKKSAGLGYRPAQNTLSRIYFGSNDAEALKWYKKADEQGDWDALYALACLYASGRGTKKKPLGGLKSLLN